MMTLAKAKKLTVDAASKHGINVTIIKAVWLSKDHVAAHIDILVGGKIMGVLVYLNTDNSINVYFGVRDPNR